MSPSFVQIIVMIVVIVWSFALKPLGSGELKIEIWLPLVEYSFHAPSVLSCSSYHVIHGRSFYERLKEVMDKPISIDPNENGITETATRGI